MDVKQAIQSLDHIAALDFKYPEHWDKWDAQPWPIKLACWWSVAITVFIGLMFIPMLRAEGRVTYWGQLGGMVIFVDMLCGRRTKMTQLMAALQSVGGMNKRGELKETWNA